MFQPDLDKIDINKVFVERSPCPINPSPQEEGQEMHATAKAADHQGMEVNRQ